MAESYSISYTTTSITFTFNTTGAYYLRCFVRTQDNTTVIDEWVGYHSSGYSITFSGLDEGTTYVCNAQYSSTDGYGGTWIGAKTFTTKTSSSASRPSKFGWTNSVVEQGKDAIIYATEWNELTENINEVRAYRKANGYTVSAPIQYSFTKAVKGNDLTADMFNEVLEAIKGISGYGTWFRDFNPGEDCTAELLNSVVTELNTIP